jgi:glucosamine-6-phosphate deaminase
MPPMRIEIVPDDATLANGAADALCDAVRRKPDAALGLPTGNTPILTYRELQRRQDAGEASFARATAWAIDEFADATRATPGTNSVFYREHLRITLRALHVPNPGAVEPEAHIRAFAAALRKAGGLDLCVLGIGRNGHVAFNEPGSPVDAPARVIDLTPVSRGAHAATFGSLDRVPHRGMTLGMADILESRKILVLAHGTHKATVVAAAIEGPQTADVPASWLQAHDDVTWLIDNAAASALTRNGRQPQA